MATVTRIVATLENTCTWSYEYDDVTLRLLNFICVNNNAAPSTGTIISQAPQRLANHAYAFDDIMQRNVDDTDLSKRFVYRCTLGGTTAATPPTFPEVIGQTVIDGTVRWRCIGLDRQSKTVVAGDSKTFPIPAGIADAFNIGVDARGRLVGIDHQFGLGD